MGQLDSPDGGAARTTTFTEQPKCVELYYSACAMIDRHNRCRQETLGLERKLGTLEWDKRVNLSIFSMCIVDAWLTWKSLQVSGSDGDAEDQQNFYSFLAEEMIDNTIDSRARRVRISGEEGPRLTFSSPILIKCTRVKKKQVADGNAARSVPTTHTQQGYCKVCFRKVTTVCNACLEATGKDVFFAILLVPIGIASTSINCKIIKVLFFLLSNCYSL